MLSESLQDALSRAHEEGYKEGFAAGWQQAREFPNTSLLSAEEKRLDKIFRDEMAAKMDAALDDARNSVVALKQQVAS